MPPKKDGPSKKTNEKVKSKIIEDKTFGLKNKKGAKQQKFIQQVQKQVSSKDQQKGRGDLDPNVERQKKLEEEKKKQEELKSLFKPVLQTVPKGVDPKSVVCVYFKQGICQKGDRCKFSHDLAIERKAEKRNIYEDVRSKKDDNMENWDEDELNNVVNQKHGEDNKKKVTTTQIVCKYFIEAVENKTYGWFWNCPNGENCMYRHALPPGFTLKSEMKENKAEDEVSLEMLVEKERASLGSNVTKVTLQSFLEWKARKIMEKKEETIKQEEKKKKDFKLGFHSGLTGKDLFTFDPTMVGDEDNDGEDFDYRQRVNTGEEGEENMKEIREDFFTTNMSNNDVLEEGVSHASVDRFDYMASLMAQEAHAQKKREEHEQALAAAAADKATANVETTADNASFNGATCGKQRSKKNVDNECETEENGANIEEEFKKSIKKPAAAAASAAIADSANLQIDESLFNLEDLPDLDEELDKLEI